MAQLEVNPKQMSELHAETAAVISGGTNYHFPLSLLGEQLTATGLFPRDQMLPTWTAGDGVRRYAATSSWG